MALGRVYLGSGTYHRCTNIVHLTSVRVLHASRRKLNSSARARTIITGTKAMSLVSRTFFLDSFAQRQWDDPDYGGTRVSYDKAAFVQRIQEEFDEVGTYVLFSLRNARLTPYGRPGRKRPKGRASQPTTNSTKGHRC